MKLLRPITRRLPPGCVNPLRNTRKREKVDGVVRSTKNWPKFYRRSAESFVASENWEPGANCYARAQLAYTAARCHSRARRCAQEAGTHYAMWADSLEKQQSWAEAGRLYVLFGRSLRFMRIYGIPVDDSLSRATICYFNVAENARAAGNLRSVLRLL